MPRPFQVDLPFGDCCNDCCDDDINLKAYLCANFQNATDPVVVGLTSGATFSGTISSFFDDIVSIVNTDGDTTVIDLDEVITVTSSLALPQPCFFGCGSGCGGFPLVL